MNELLILFFKESNKPYYYVKISIIIKTRKPPILDIVRTTQLIIATMVVDWSAGRLWWSLNENWTYGQTYGLIKKWTYQNETNSRMKLLFNQTERRFLSEHRSVRMARQLCHKVGSGSGPWILSSSDSILGDYHASSTVSHTSRCIYVLYVSCGPVCCCFYNRSWTLLKAHCKQRSVVDSTVICFKKLHWH